MTLSHYNNDLAKFILEIKTRDKKLKQGTNISQEKIVISKH